MLPAVADALYIWDRRLYTELYTLYILYRVRNKDQRLLDTAMHGKDFFGRLQRECRRNHTSETKGFVLCYRGLRLASGALLLRTIQLRSRTKCQQQQQRRQRTAASSPDLAWKRVWGVAGSPAGFLSWNEPWFARCPTLCRLSCVAVSGAEEGPGGGGSQSVGSSQPGRTPANSWDTWWHKAASDKWQSRWAGQTVVSPSLLGCPRILPSRPESC